jgi:succinyl-diaminopimelate desuccinylase
MTPSMLIDTYREEMIHTLQSLIRIPSVKAALEPGAPFGSEVARVLRKALLVAESMGFSTKNLDGYIGYADMGEGDVQDALAILVHLDVVPEGDGWTYPPYEGVVEQGRIYGRGAVDNKGPAVAALYAMAAVLRGGCALKRRVRLIFGCDEESGWADIAHYDRTDTMPVMGFSPDGSYPVINGEKNILHLELSKQFEPNALDGIVTLQGGRVANMVPSHACCVFRHEGALSFAQRQEEGTLMAEAHGKSAHGSTPQQGENAIAALIGKLSGLALEGEGAVFMGLLARLIGKETNGASLGIAADTPSGQLSLNLGVIGIDACSASAMLDIRSPIDLPVQQLLDTIRRHFEPHGVQVTVRYESRGHYVPEHDPLVQTLLGVYTRQTGGKPECLTIGGGTYARALKKGVAFGPVYPGAEEMAHKADEYYEIEALIRDAKMMAEAIEKLACVQG